MADEKNGSAPPPPPRRHQADDTASKAQANTSGHNGATTKDQPWIRKTPFGIASCCLGLAACLLSIIGMVAAAIGSENQGSVLETVCMIICLVTFGLAVPGGAIGLCLAAFDILRDVMSGRISLRDPKTGRLDWRYMTWDDLSLSWIGLVLGALPLCICGVVAVVLALAAAANPRRTIIIQE